MRKILITSLLAWILPLTGCSIYAIDIQQGNTLEAEDIAKLEPGMTRQQVQFVMGTALLKDPFHQDRWDYVYTFKEQGKPTVRKLLTLYFKDGALARIDESELEKTPLKTIR